MTLYDIFEDTIVTRKTVWRKRGDDISKRSVEHAHTVDVTPRTRYEIKKDATDAG